MSQTYVFRYVYVQTQQLKGLLNEIQILFCSQVGQADLSFFSVDCFHISERAHAEMAIALWNNMVRDVCGRYV